MYVVVVHHIDDHCLMDEAGLMDKASLMDDAKFLFFCYMMDEVDFSPYHIYLLND